MSAYTEIEMTQEEEKNIEGKIDYTVFVHY